MRLALAAALVAAFVAPLAAQPSLFAPVDGARIVLDDRQQEILGLLEGELGVDAVEIVRVDDAALTGGADLRIDLLSVEVLFSAVSVATRPSGHVSWYGRASGPTGATWGALVTRDGMVTGEIHFGGRVYPVRPLTGGLHAVARKSMAAYQAHPEGYEAFVESNRERLAAERAEDQARLAAQPRGASMTTTVDVLVPYTTNVAAAYADPSLWPSRSSTSRTLRTTTRGFRTWTFGSSMPTRHRSRRQGISKRTSTTSPAPRMASWTRSMPAAQPTGPTWWPCCPAPTRSASAASRS